MSKKTTHFSPPRPLSFDMAWFTYVQYRRALITTKHASQTTLSYVQLILLTYLVEQRKAELKSGDLSNVLNSASSSNFYVNMLRKKGFVSKIARGRYVLLPSAFELVGKFRHAYNSRADGPFRWT